MSMVLSRVVGFKLTCNLNDGVIATDLVLTVTQMLRKHGVVGKFVEFYGDGMGKLSLSDRATIANMSPEYGATMGFFPVDHVTLEYLKLTDRSDETINMIEAYLRPNRMFVDYNEPQVERVYSSYLELDLTSVEPCISCPKRPHDRVTLKEMKEDLHSCMELGVAIVAKKDLELGLEVKPWIKTRLSLGSKVVRKYLQESGLHQNLDHQGFQLVGYGCTTCIGNSGDLHESVSAAILDNDIVATAVLFGNRNFEGRVHPSTQANYLASPPLVVAYALAGTVDIEFETTHWCWELGWENVYLRDIWPSTEEIEKVVQSSVLPDMFKLTYQIITQGNPMWNQLSVRGGTLYTWDPKSTYIHNLPYFKRMKMTTPGAHGVKDAYFLVNFGDNITTNHISPAVNIHKDSPAARYLMECEVDRRDFNSYGSHRGQLASPTD